MQSSNCAKPEDERLPPGRLRRGADFRAALVNDVIASCERLSLTLAARAPEAERRRRLHPETIDEAADAGLFSMLVPTRHGGGGLGLDSLAECTRILAHGCPAAAWTLSFLVMHNWLVARFPEETVEELFADRPWVLAPAPLNPSGTATPVDGGYRVTGRWEWATGVEHADWVLVHALVDEPGTFSTRFVLLPRDEIDVVDVWHTSGMRATGSNTVVVRDRFVPAGRSIGRAQLMDAAAPVQGDAMSALPVVAVLALVAAAPALGAAEAAVELFRQRLSERVLAYTLGEKQADQPAARVRLATALSEVRAARAVWERALSQISDAAMTAEPTVRDRMAARLAAASTVRLSRQAISTVCDGSGASIYMVESTLQRLQRDVEVLKGHVIFDWDRCAELAGRIELGLEPSMTDMV